MKRPLVSEAEWVRFSIREENRVPREAMPHCFGMPVLSLPECNHLAGKTPNLCQLRQSCALAYAERLKLDTKLAYAGGAELGYPTLVSMIKEEEKRIKFVPELGKKVETPPKAKVVPPVQEEEVVTMASIVEPPKVVVPKVAKPKPVVVRTGAPPLRVVILEVLGQASGWVSKSDLVIALEKKLNRSPLNNAVLHKISLVLLPKTQAKLGYKVEKKIEKGPSGFIYSYKMGDTTDGPT